MDFNVIKKNIAVRVNETLIDSTLVELESEQAEPFEEYFQYFYSTHFILANITFPGNSITKIEYSFSITYFTHYYGNWLQYIVGTGNYWTQPFNETVEFRIKGIQPDKYIKNCEIIPFWGGKSYIWNWINVLSFGLERVGVYFSFNNPLIPVIVGGSIGLLVVISIITVVITKGIKKINQKKEI